MMEHTDTPCRFIVCRIHIVVTLCRTVSLSSSDAGAKQMLCNDR